MQLPPPRGPNRHCPQFESPVPGFFVKHGSYWPRCRENPIQRFRCRSCLRTFSMQTFRLDYRDRRPECNERLFEFLVGGSGLRHSARRLRLDVHAVQRKFRKIARTCRALHRNLMGRLPPGRTFVLDEEETYEQASIKPLTLPAVESGLPPLRRRSMSRAR